MATSLNEDKTEVLIMGKDAQREDILSSLGNLAPQIKPEVKKQTNNNNLFVISAITKIAFNYLRNIARLRLFLPLEDA